MATVVVEVDSEPSCSIPNPTSPSPSLSHRFLDSKFYLLVVIGELVTEEHLRRAIANIERGEAAGSEDAAGSAAAHPTPPLPPPPPRAPAPSPSADAPGAQQHPPPHAHPTQGWGTGVAGPRSPALYSTRVSRRSPSPSSPPRVGCGRCGARAAGRAPLPPVRGAAAGLGRPPRQPGSEPPARHCWGGGGRGGSPAPPPPPSPSARRHRRVGVAQSALRSLWQPGADKGRPRRRRQTRQGMGMGRDRDRGRGCGCGCCPQTPVPPPPDRTGGMRGVFLLGGKGCPSGSAAVPLCASLDGQTFLSAGEFFRTRALYAHMYISIKKKHLGNKANTCGLSLVIVRLRAALTRCSLVLFLTRRYRKVSQVK